MFSQKLFLNQRIPCVLNILYYGARQVRMFCVRDDLWWDLNDVCSAIGISNVPKAAARLADHEKMVLAFDESPSQPCGGVQETILVSKSGLRNLLRNLNNPEANAFQHWVAYHARPVIQKDEDWTMGRDSVYAGGPEDAALDQQIRDLCIQHKAQAMLLREWEPKARYYDATLKTPKLLTTTAIATEYGVTARWLNKYLQENGIQYKRNGTWVLCRPYADKGYTYPQTGSCACKRYPHWTQEGRVFLHDFLREGGLLPLYERPYVPMDGFWGSR